MSNLEYNLKSVIDEMNRKSVSRELTGEEILSLMNMLSSALMRTINLSMLGVEKFNMSWNMKFGIKKIELIARTRL